MTRSVKPVPTPADDPVESGSRRAYLLATIVFQVLVGLCSAVAFTLAESVSWPLVWAATVLAFLLLLALWRSGVLVLNALNGVGTACFLVAWGSALYYEYRPSQGDGVVINPLPVILLPVGALIGLVAIGVAVTYLRRGTRTLSAKACSVADKVSLQLNV